MGRKCRDGCELLRANALGLAAVAAVLRCQHQPPLHGIVVAFGPAVVATLDQEHEFLGRERRLLLRLVEFGPIRVQLVASVLGDEDTAGRIDAEAFRIADPGGVALERRERLIGDVRVVAPDAAARLELLARLSAGRSGAAILKLAAVGRRRDVHVQMPIRVDGERVHGMVAAERQTAHDGLRAARRHDGARGEYIAYDLVVDLRVQRAPVQSDPRAAGAARRNRLAESAIHVCLAGSRGVLQGNEKAPGVRRLHCHSRSRTRC